MRPFGIISVDWEGNFSTYSPELLGISLEPYGDFFFGNVTREHFSDALETPKFRQVLSDIQAGIKRCAETCSYYGYCGGGWGGCSRQQVLREWLARIHTDHVLPLCCAVALDIVLNDIEQSLEVGG